MSMPSLATPLHKLTPFLTGLTLLLSGCSVVDEMERQRESREFLSRGAALLARQDYRGAVLYNERALGVAGTHAPGDEALFTLGLVYADTENPDKNNNKAVDFFRAVAWDFPRSPLVAQSKLWVKILEENDRLSREQEKAGQANAALAKKNQEIARDNARLSEQNQGLSQDNQRLKEILEKTKRVDLEIEQKKRETER